jgi:large subunit ribosomal protein L25
MELNASERKVFGKNLKALRKEGQIPAEFYGRGMENRALTIQKKEFQSLFKTAGENTVITLVMEGKKQPSLIYDVHYNPVSGEILNVDFYGVRMDEKIRTAVPVEFVGEAPAVKEKGGVLAKGVTEIEVEALPGDLPHSFTVDISVLAELDQSIYVKDIAIPANVRIMLEPETAVVTVTPPAPEEEIAAPVMDVTDVKVETEEKKAEREKEAAAEGAPEA